MGTILLETAEYITYIISQKTNASQAEMIIVPLELISLKRIHAERI